MKGLDTIKKSFYIVIITSTCTGCIEPFDAEIVDFESTLVVDATITDEMKVQTIFLTRSYEFDESPFAETGADVRLTDDAGTTHTFREGDPGVYVSDQAFAAASNRDYRLHISTGIGREYTSEVERLSPAAGLDSIYAERIINDTGEDGMAIFVDNNGVIDDSSYYLYEYEETYKIIPPFWLPIDFKIVPADQVGMEEVFFTDGQESVILASKEIQDRVCFNTDLSTRIILVDTDELDENRISRFMVRFVNRNNYIITHRYSILVRQRIISRRAFDYFETLRDLSSSESLLSENQPGFFNSNVVSDDDPNEKVLGFFDISSVSEKRLFFNFEDFYPGERLPPFIDECRTSMIETSLLEIVRLGRSHYNDPNSFLRPGDELIPRLCADCTVLGSNVEPEFWIE